MGQHEEGPHIGDLLEGEALAVWLELSEDEQSDYNVVKEKLIAKLRPA